MVVLQWDKGTLKPAAGIPNTKGVQVICISSQKTQQQYCTLLVVKKKTLYVYELSDVLVIEKVRQSGWRLADSTFKPFNRRCK